MICFNDIGSGYRIAAEAGTQFNPRVDQCISRFRGRQLLGGAVYTGYTGASIQVHMAGFSPDWMDRDLIWVCFDYPFGQLGCERLFGLVPEDNTKSLELCRKFGFKEGARIEGVFPTGACVVMVMLREDCRWLKIRPKGIRPLQEGKHGWEIKGTGSA